MAKKPIEPVARTPNDGKPRPWTVLTVYQSESGSWEYEIRVSHETGVTYCTCLGWRFNKKCKHLDAYKADPVFVDGASTAAPAEDLGGRSFTTSRAKSTAPAVSPAEALRSAVYQFGITLTPKQAQTVCAAVLEAAGAVMPTAPTATGRTRINAQGVRVVILPD